jgi:hypothetical protein
MFIYQENYWYCLGQQNEVRLPIPGTTNKAKKSPWYSTLTVNIFRRDPQLTPNVEGELGDARNIPSSQAA